MEILIVEDSRFLRTTVERTLTKAGHHPIGVSDGREGLRVAHSRLPDLILLDMMLPVLESTSVLRELKQDTSTAQIPAIVLTGLARRNKKNLLKAGAAVFIEKSALGLEKSAEIPIQIVSSVLGASSGVGGGSENQSPQPREDVETEQAKDCSGAPS